MTSDSEQAPHPELTAEGKLLAVLDLGYCEVRAVHKTWQGSTVIDIRKFVPSATAGGELRASKKGISLRILQWRQLLPAIVAAVGTAPDQDQGDQAEGDEEQ